MEHDNGTISVSILLNLIIRCYIQSCVSNKLNEEYSGSLILIAILINISFRNYKLKENKDNQDIIIYELKSIYDYLPHCSFLNSSKIKRLCCILLEEYIKSSLGNNPNYFLNQIQVSNNLLPTDFVTPDLRKIQDFSKFQPSNLSDIYYKLIGKEIRIESKDSNFCWLRICYFLLPLTLPNIVIRRKTILSILCIVDQLFKHYKLNRDLSNTIIWDSYQIAKYGILPIKESKYSYDWGNQLIESFNYHYLTKGKGSNLENISLINEFIISILRLEIDVKVFSNDENNKQHVSRFLKITSHYLNFQNPLIIP